MWQSGYFSAIGSSHINEGSLCQDTATVETSADGQWIAATVCDGAGSAIYAAEGSKYVSTNFNSKLLALGGKLQNKLPGGWVNDEIIRSVLEVREGLRQLARSDDISEYHTTLVSVLIGPNGGLSVHIGDGLVIAGEATSSKKLNKWSIKDFSVSYPENGEYKNETYFITESIWLKHLRIKPMPKANWALLVSDGGAEYLYEKGQLNPALVLEPILLPKQDELSGSFPINCSLSEKIKKHLANDLYKDLTTDDKTLVVIAHPDIAVQSLEISVEDFLKIDINQSAILGQHNFYRPTNIPVSNVSPVFKGKTNLLKKTCFYINKKWRMIFYTIVFFLLVLSVSVAFKFFWENRD
jgi:hypothetical protein